MTVSSYQRRLPHWHPVGQPLFLTWRLHGSLPPNRSFPDANVTSGRAFVTMDRLLDHARTGPLYLQQPEIAQLVIDALLHGQDPLNHYTLHAFVVMPNHVHLLITPQVEVPKLLRSLKGITAKRANQILGLTGRAFWQEESYDHVVRNGKEFRRICGYIEENPVRAGLAGEAGEYRWSSAWRGGSRPGGRLRPRGAAPHIEGGLSYSKSNAACSSERACSSPKRSVTTMPSRYAPRASSSRPSFSRACPR